MDTPTKTPDEQIAELKEENRRLRAELNKQVELRELEAEREKLRAAAEPRDVKRAARDTAYMAEWKATDPAGFDREWRAFMQQKHREVVGAK